MDLKTVVLLVDSSPDTFVRAQYAVQLCLRHSAHLVALCVSAPKSSCNNSESFVRGKEAMQRLIKHHRGDAVRNSMIAHKLFLFATEGQNITYEYHWIERDEVYRSTILSALHADLIVMGTPSPNFTSGIWSLKSILSKTGLPVIVVPPLWVKKEAPNRILAGWNGSSIPHQLIAGLLLLLADSVSIDLIANDRSGKIAGKQPGGDLKRYMARHGAKVSVQMPIGYVRTNLLFGMAEQRNFDLVAFAASRLSWIDAFPFGIGQPYLSTAAKVPFLIAP